MTERIESASLAVSITWSNAPRRSGGNPLQRHEGVVNSLRAALEAIEQPATWALDHLADRPALALLDLGEGLAQELAILADGSWFGRDKARSVLLAGLTRQLGGAQHHGFLPQTIVAPDSDISGHGELLARRGIRCLANEPFGTGTNLCSRGATALRYGLWHVPVTVTLPWTRGWLWGGATAELRRHMLMLADGRGAAHLRIDVAELARSGRTAMSSVKRTLEQLPALRERYRLTARTLAAAAQALARPRFRPTPARSVLRAA